MIVPKPFPAPLPPYAGAIEIAVAAQNQTVAACPLAEVRGHGMQQRERARWGHLVDRPPVWRCRNAIKIAIASLGNDSRGLLGHAAVSSKIIERGHGLGLRRIWNRHQKKRGKR